MHEIAVLTNTGALGTRRLAPACAVFACLVGCVDGGEVALDEPAPGQPLVLVTEAGLASIEVEPFDEIPLTQGPQTLHIRTSPLYEGDAAELASVDPFMPAHGHGTTPSTLSEESDGYRVDDINLFMPGRWEIRMTVDVSGTEDFARFSVDVE